MLRPIILARVFFVLLASACGYWISYGKGTDYTRATEEAMNTSILACVMALVIVVFEYSMRTVSSKRVFLASVGLLFGLVVSSMVYETIPDTVMSSVNARILCNFLFGYLGMMIALKHADQLNLSALKFVLPGIGAGQMRLLDTSVIIDGRIREMVLSGFVSGNILVPTFVIDELQMLADSSDSIKRAKGRRGLSMLETLQTDYPSLQIFEKDYPSVRDVDRKLIEMAKEMGAQIVTNDFNLQKVASLHKVSVLNINELADMLKPAVFVGETFKLLVTREGKEINQGVGYLKDGTMVVVDEGRDHIGNEITVVVSSILQTNTGRMVFGRPLLTESAAEPVRHSG